MSLSPAEAYKALVAATHARMQAPWQVIALQGVMGGFWIGLGSLFCLHVQSNLLPYGKGVAILVAGAVFPLGLIGLVVTGGHLFTGNCFLVTPGLLNGSLGRMRMMAMLAGTWFTNFVGCVFVAVVIHWAGWSDNEAIADRAKNVATAKVSLSFVQCFARGLAANWMVCLGLFQAFASGKDGFARMFSIWLPLFALAALGFEHSVANMFYIVVGILSGAEISMAQFFFDNMITATISNALIGALVGLAMALTYDEHFQPSPASLQEPPAKAHKEVALPTLMTTAVQEPSKIAPNESV